jgi:imidazolonepropionase-like amidohydrolase
MNRVNQVTRSAPAPVTAESLASMDVPFLRSRSVRLAALPAALALAALFAVPARAQVLALTGGTVHPVSGPAIAGGTVLVENGRIVAVGASVDVPAGARVVDCTGKHIYPGFVHANTTLGLHEVTTIQGSDDTQETGPVNPNQRAEVMYNPDSDFLAVARLNGITTALSVPGGGSVRGTSALMHLDGWTQEDIAVRAPVALHVQWPNMTPIRAFFETRSDEEQAKARDEAIRVIADAFQDARAYWKARGAEGAGGVPRHDGDVRWDGMRRALKGEIPVVFHCDALNQIRAVLRFCDEQQLANVAILGGYDSWRAADELKRRNIPVIVAGVLATPNRAYDPYDEAFAVAGRLARAGVRFCIADEGGGFSAANARNLPQHAAMASAFGLPREEALRAVTLYPAQILGVGDRLGSIEPGKVADLQVTDGDPLEITTRCEQVIVAGKLVPMESRQTRLFEKYDHRPRGPKARPRGAGTTTAVKGRSQH